MINVSELKKGIVIDHIAPGHGFKIFKALHLDAINDPVVLLCNIDSEKIGIKDMIKIETDIPLNMDVLGLIDPDVTVNYVENGKVTGKLKITLPTEVDGIMHCKNPRCITQSEHVDKIRFHLVNRDKRIYRCEYCDSYTTFDFEKDGD